MEEESKQSEIIKTALENVKTMLDANTVTGTPINTDSGTVIIPVSKLFIGLASGGVDYFGKRNPSAIKSFGGGGGTGVTVSPVGFLVIEPNGKVDFLNVNQEPQDPIVQFLNIVENSPELIEKIKSVFSRKKEIAEFEEK
ncbi:MAG: sporulation protein YtfJ [Clostridia bacterium]|nr:sporulation protein YtfJ [Clostridia bacterium]